MKIEKKKKKKKATSLRAEVAYGHPEMDLGMA
jgi:hypothetical protein